jgi:hypothetical protein
MGRLFYILYAIVVVVAVSFANDGMPSSGGGWGGGTMGRTGYSSSGTHK